MLVLLYFGSGGGRRWCRRWWESRVRYLCFVVGIVGRKEERKKERKEERKKGRKREVKRAITTAEQRPGSVTHLHEVHSIEVYTHRMLFVQVLFVFGLERN